MKELFVKDKKNKELISKINLYENRINQSDDNEKNIKNENEKNLDNWKNKNISENIKKKKR
jgi:hypothetical protein